MLFFGFASTRAKYESGSTQIDAPRAYRNAEPWRIFHRLIPFATIHYWTDETGRRRAASRVRWGHMPSTSTAVVAIVDVRTALATMRSARSYASARDFLDSLASETPDCPITDFQMPEMTNLELQEQLSRSGVSIPTIVMTARGDAEIRKRCLATGATAYLTKPFDSDVLLASINSTTT